MKQCTPEGRCVDPERGYNRNVSIHGCDLFLLEQWSDDSTESDDAQMVQIFERFVKMPVEERLVWERRQEARGHYAQDLTQAERDLLFRIRRADELDPEVSEIIVLRTYYGPGSDEACAELIDKDALSDPLVFDNKDLYDFGSQWQRIFTRVPQLLAIGDRSLQKLAPLKEEACRLARGLPLEDYSRWMSWRPTPGVPMPLDEAFSTYQRFSHCGFILVLDELALGPNWRDIDALTAEQQAAETELKQQVLWSGPDTDGSPGQRWCVGSAMAMEGGPGQRWWPPVRREGEYWEQRKDERKMLMGWFDASGEFTRWNWMTSEEIETQQGVIDMGVYEDHAIWVDGCLDPKKLEAYVEEHKAADQTRAVRGKDSTGDGVQEGKDSNIDGAQDVKEDACGKED